MNGAEPRTVETGATSGSVELATLVVCVTPGRVIATTRRGSSTTLLGAVPRDVAGLAASEAGEPSVIAREKPRLAPPSTPAFLL